MAHREPIDPNFSPKVNEATTVPAPMTVEDELAAEGFVTCRLEPVVEERPLGLANSVALVTGAGSRIGRMTALLFAREGVRVVAVDTDRDALRDTVRLVSEMHAVEAIPMEADVSRASDAERVVAAAVDRLGKLDIVFNYATIEQQIFGRPLEHIAEQEWNRVMDHTIKSVFLVAKHAIPALRRNRGGVIINSTSILGLVGVGSSAAYSAAQGAVIQLTRQMAVECARDRIRVNAVAAAFSDVSIAQEFARHTNTFSDASQLIAMHPLGRLCKPEDVAEAVLYLASPNADFITGVVLPVDGGYTAR